MTPREVVTRAIEFRTPPRLPVLGHGEANDSYWITYEQVKPPQAEGDEFVDQWLCRWDRTEQANMGQVKGHPLEDLDAMKDYPWPDGLDARRYAAVPQRVAAVRADPVERDKYGMCGIFMGLWERMQALHGFENCMVGLMDGDRRLDEMADRIVQYNTDVIRSMHRVAGDAIHGFDFTDDWGTQTDLHLSPDLFRRFFQPRYAKFFKVIHECGWHVSMHSCGKINKALGPLIEIGLDMINMQQPLTNGITAIGREFAGKICFDSLCDIQKTLPRGDRDAIERQARELIHSWGTPAGGFILSDYGDAAAIGALPETKVFMLETFRRIDPWKHGWA